MITKIIIVPAIIMITITLPATGNRNWHQKLSASRRQATSLFRWPLNCKIGGEEGAGHLHLKTFSSFFDLSLLHKVRS